LNRPSGAVLSVSSGSTHAFSREIRPSITLVAGLGVEGDAHSGETVRQRSRVRADPTQPNLRQVHLIHSELLDELRTRGFAVGAGDLGENITTVGLDLLALPRDAELHIGSSAVMGVVLAGGPIRPGDPIGVALPAEPHRRLERV
jgi:hypothetical protein